MQNAWRVAHWVSNILANEYSPLRLQHLYLTSTNFSPKLPTNDKLQIDGGVKKVSIK